MILKCNELQKERCDIVFSGEKKVIAEYMVRHLYGSHAVSMSKETLERKVQGDNEITRNDLVQSVPSVEDVENNEPKANPDAVVLKEGEDSKPKVEEKDPEKANKNPSKKEK